MRAVRSTKKSFCAASSNSKVEPFWPIAAALGPLGSQTGGVWLLFFWQTVAF
ncbi:hypothetical protein RIdsm_05683 (plasmid) [Roseovarius indicus]|uniref:Uncharacterized protein n=1 Tax=Roseovarius indicus TaxID=540747 RepID=A0A5P3AKL2_9RHOB|nr:hypothetical protein RIdsm_05683 [Roseovarius indicus]SFE86854.1 hypothetical protein SAMN04488031_13214 [Roseovarius indicus]